jgi:hypothetical protein
VAFLVLPGIGLLLNTWLGVLLGIILYIGSRLFSPEEEELLSQFWSHLGGIPQEGKNTVAIKMAWLASLDLNGNAFSLCKCDDIVRYSHV